MEYCILNDKPPVTNEIEGAKCIATCAACWQSIRTGGPAKVFNEFEGGGKAA
jgi:hypothetical protein